MITRCDALKRLALVCAAAGLCLLAACAAKERAPRGVMDTPEHHAKAAKRLLDQGEVARAGQEFDLALELDHDYGPALAGKGLVMALQGEDLDAAFSLTEEGVQEADGDEQKVQALLFEVRARAAVLKGQAQPAGVQYKPDWRLMKTVRADAKRAKLLEPQNPAIPFYYGEAALYALEFDEAAEQYSQVMALKSGFEQQADQRWRLLQKARRAAPVTDLGKSIVLVEELSRADMAGLLAEELNIARFYTKTTPITEAAFKTPEQAEDEGETVVPEDIAGHPLQADIEEVVQYGVQGLEVYPDGDFRPDEHVSRVELALMLQDLIVRAMRDDELSTKHVGQKSPFPDLPSSHPAFNAAMVVTTRGLMGADKDFGRFRPGDPVAGVDALLSIRELKRVLSPFEKP
jgi:tetratricopeptide (TPR) repeat protein